ncbi:LolA family protein [Brevibacillus marinus]|uniref:LolA family protein n=1 Tax=Brevibacillus marinus TaxID=2496837 RepID=UPI000F840963|nr:hypothetical protein [Brevibacillus marinus]
MKKQTRILSRLLVVSVVLGSLVTPIYAANGTPVKTNSSVLNTEQVISEIKSKKRVPTYTEVTTVTYNPNSNTYSKGNAKYWDNTMNGYFLSIHRTENQPATYSLSKGGKTITYKEGDSRAVVANAPVTFVASIDPIYNINKLTTTTTVSFIGEEIVNNRKTYHLKGKGKTINVPLPPQAPQNLQKRTHTYPDLEMWFDKETGTVIKSKMLNHEMNVTKIEVSPKFDDNTFTLPLPAGVKMVNLDDVIKEQQQQPGS